jgi:flagellar motor switch protein FliG
MADDQTFTGAQRAAIFLLGVGEETATEIMRHMSPKEVQQIGEAMASIKTFSNEQVTEVLSSFQQDAAKVNPLALGATDFTKRVMTSALGEGKAKSILSRVLEKPETSQGVDALNWMAPEAIAGVLLEEHPQIVATILTQIDEEHAAQVLGHFTPAFRKDVMLRIARMEVLDPAAVEELNRVMESQLGRMQKTPPKKIEGVVNAANILNATNVDLESEILDALREIDNDLGERVKEKMFIFDNLMALDDRGFQRLIREISTENLVVALKGTDEALADRFFSNMSERAADILKDDMDAKGPVKLVDVEAAQKEIIRVAQALAEEGELQLGKDTGDYV